MDETKEISAQELKRFLDTRDLNQELAGLETGRIKRFLPEDAVDTTRSEQKKSERATLTALQLLLLLDPAYAQVRSRVEQKIDSADQRLTEMHLEAEAMRARCEAYLRSLEIRAGQLPDGTKVFRGDNGDVFTIDGKMLDAEQRETVTWREDSPTWEEYNSAAHAHKRAVDYADGVAQAQRRVDEARDTLQNDQDNPTTTEELEDIESGIQQDLQKLEKMRLQASTSTLSPSELTAGFNAKSPDLDIAAFSPAEGHSVNTSPH